MGREVALCRVSLRLPGKSVCLILSRQCCVCINCAIAREGVARTAWATRVGEGASELRVCTW